MTFARSVLKFYSDLKISGVIPTEIKVLDPFKNEETRTIVSQFLHKYYNDSNRRILLMGINPGRFGAGLTGIGFTDPIRLKEVCGIDHPFEMKPELSSKFIYEVIDAFGGPGEFYSKFFISSVCPLGFVKEGRNYNYYDDPTLQKEVEPFVIDCFKKKLSFGCSKKQTFSIGQGKNVKFLNQINSQYGFFEEVNALPHPRWVMQYRLKRKKEFIREYVLKLSAVKT